MLPNFETPLVRLGNLFPQRQVDAKCEFLQPSGCFKLRGARHLLEALARQGRKPPLVVPSMGNTAIGAAVGARAFGFDMLGVVPRSISAAKDRKLRHLGAELVKIDGGGNELLEAAMRLAAERDAYFVHPHLDSMWTDGYQEIAKQLLASVPNLKSLVFPLGGGGLLMGLTEYLRAHHSQRVSLHACEPYNYPTYARYEHDRASTIADGLLLERPHPKVQERIDEMEIGVQLVGEEQIQLAMKDLYRQQGLLVEPSSAIASAFVASHLAELEEPVCAVLTGCNIADEDFYRLIL